MTAIFCMYYAIVQTLCLYRLFTVKEDASLSKEGQDMTKIILAVTMIVSTFILFGVGIILDSLDTIGAMRP